MFENQINPRSNSISSAVISRYLSGIMRSLHDIILRIRVKRRTPDGTIKYKRRRRGGGGHINIAFCILTFSRGLTKFNFINLSRMFSLSRPPIRKRTDSYGGVFVQWSGLKRPNSRYLELTWRGENSFSDLAPHKTVRCARARFTLRATGQKRIFCRSVRLPDTVSN